MNRRAFDFDHPPSRSLGLLVAWLGIVLSVGLLGLRLFADHIYLVVIPLGLGVASALYVLSTTWWRSDSPVPSLPAGAMAVFTGIVLLSLAILVLRSRTPTPRTALDYLLAAVVGTAILAQILLVDDERFSPAAVLVQVTLAAVVIRQAVLFGTPGFVGVDAWVHVPVYVQDIAANGSLSAISDTKYVMAPIYHLFGAVGTPLFGDPRTAVFLLVGTVVPLSLLFIYATATVFVGTRWAVLAAALFAFTDQFVRWGIHLIPTSLALVFFLAAVYLLTLSVLGDREPWVLGLLFGFNLAVVFTHQVTTATLLVVLGIGVVVAVLAHAFDSTAPSPVPVLTVFVLTLGVTIASWLNTPFGEESTFLNNRIEIISRTITDVGFLQLAADPVAPDTLGIPAVTNGSALAPVVDAAGFTLLFGIAVLGGLAALDWDRPIGATYVHLTTVVVLFLFVFGMQLIGFRVLIPGRWTVFLYASMSILGAVGVAVLYDRAPTGVIVAIVVLLAATYPATMVVAEKGSIDSPAFENSFTKYSYSESEIAALETIGEIHPPTVESDLRTDHPYYTIYLVPGGYDSRRLAVTEDGPVADHPVLYRNYQSRGLVTLSAGEEPPRSAVSGSFPPEFVCQPDWDRVYTNDEVTMCSPPEIETEAET
ncbi:MAG: glycosyltransferase family 39 protein [archaeon]